MKTRILIGKDLERSEVRVKTYSGGMTVVDSGDSYTEIKGRIPIMEKKFEFNKDDKEELLNKPNNFSFAKGRLVRKDKKQ